jgi:hypothetical protein
MNEEIVVVLEDSESEGEEDDQAALRAHLEDDSLPLRFREALAGFAVGEGAGAGAGAARQNRSLEECDNSVVEYISESNDQ